MKPPLPPRLEQRRTSDFASELNERARAWIPAWAIADDEPDFGRALLQIGARYNAEVAEQLDGAGVKLRDGLFDWLGVHGEAARPARVPVAFKLGDKVVDPVLATAPSRLQASVDGASVVFETATDVQLVPAKLDSIVATEQDRFYLPPPGLASLEPVLPMPEQWALKSFAAPDAVKLQLDPDEGLVPGLVLRSDGQRFRITAADKGLATIAPPLREGLAQGAIVRKVAQFSPFDGFWNDEQEHALYLGGTDLFDIAAEATLDILGAQDLGRVAWEYWGKRAKADDPEEVAWQPLEKLPVQAYANALTLQKPEGAVEPREIVKGMSARWIRAVAQQVELPPFGADQLSVRINYTPIPATCQSAATKDSVGFEAMANTTPLVVDNAFYPLGSAPRQFDAFYIGSAEAFSKKDALVQLCFELADLSFRNFASLRFSTKPAPVLAGVTRDGGLQLLEFSGTPARLVRLHNRQALHPPSPGLLGARVDDAPIALQQGAIAIWERGSDVLVAAPSDDAVWMWRESYVPLFGFFFSGWRKLPDVPFTPPAAGQPTPPIDSLVFVAPYLIALRDAALYKCNPDDADPAWTPVAATVGTTDVEFTRIAPVFMTTLTPTINARAVGVAKDLKLYALTFSGTPLKADCRVLRTAVDPDITPAAILRVDNRLVAAAVGTGTAGPSLLGFESNVGALTQAGVAEAPLGTARVIGNAIDAGVANGRGVFALSLAASDGTSNVSRWSPFEAPLPDLVFATPVPPGLGPAAGAPVVLADQLVAPVLSSQVLVAPSNPADCVKRQAPLRSAIITRTTGDPLQATDRVAFTETTGETIASATAPTQQGDERLFVYDVRAMGETYLVYPPAGPGGTLSNVDATDLRRVEIDPAHTVTPNQTRLLITTTATSTQTYLVAAFDNATNIATLDRDLVVPTTPPAQVTYWLPKPVPTSSERRVRPLLVLDPATNGNWDAALLDRTVLALPHGNPDWQVGHAFQVDINGRPMLVELATPWVVPPPVVGGQAEFIVDAAVQAWAGQLADTTSNPALSWEYWNGTGWWNLNATDRTQHLKRSGAITFKVPADLRPTDWSGKTSHWIRARLIGGDYGQEEVTVITSPTSTANQTKQTFERNSDNIRAPYVAKLHVSYAMKDGVLPTFVLAQDSGSIRDQSDANRTPNAIVEAFVPLPVLLGRLSGAAVRADSSECPKPCDCPGASATSATMNATVLSGPVVESAGRALFLGFKGPLSGGPVRLYLRVVEPKGQGARDALHVEALVADRFVPVVVEDDTRGLGESGMLALVFDAQPTPRELFGTTLRWLRVTASENAATWAPILQGAYLNAAWASATETMRYERLGSSEGAPNLVLNLARPPVLRNTLELRVREPLGDEERAKLLADDPGSVVNNVPDLPGDWVRWEQVFDPADEAPDKRAFSLDEATGEIVFGDGEHGMIPPIGRDSIVAFRYQRTEPAADGSDRVPANAVAARDKLNLGSPVAGVEAVFAADQAAGGAPPEDAPRILRFGGARLRHRNRAVSAPDLEDLALQSSPDIAQARCFASRNGVRLVVAMRGADPMPNAAQRRELERLLRSASPVTLGPLRIAGPILRELGAELQLRVQDLDDAGAVARDVRERLAAWFDTVTGGVDGEGWPLGRSPDATDIALALVDTPRLAGLLDVVLLEIVEGVRERAWPASLRASDLVVLRDDALHLVFSPAEEAA